MPYIIKNYSELISTYDDQLLEYVHDIRDWANRRMQNAGLVRCTADCGYNRTNYVEYTGVRGTVNRITLTESKFNGL